MNYKIEVKTYTFKEAEGEQLQSPDKVIEALKDDFTPEGEEMYLLCLNIKNKVIEKILLAKGGYNTIITTAADIIGKVLKNDSRSFILAHNHPSMDTEPSKEDIIFTKKIQKAAEIMGLSFLDHIIYSHDDYYSFKKNNLI